MERTGYSQEGSSKGTQKDSIGFTHRNKISKKRVEISKTWSETSRKEMKWRYKKRTKSEVSEGMT